ncbi:MAG: hypothetical protein J5885_01365 [Clostridia bacterium]|nr:hypothetical protein [Clostridia bacterium]
MWHRIDSYSDDTIDPTSGLPYDESWIVFVLNDENYRMRIDCGPKGAYVLYVGKLCQNWQMALGDFFDFHNTAKHNIVLALSQNALDDALKKYEGHSCRDRFLRNYENPVLIHSTTLKSYDQICKDGCLKCWNKLRKEGGLAEKEPIGKLLGDPVDLRNYILFGAGVTGEIVVNSKEKRRIVMDWDQPYQPGARLYFDMKRIAEDGLLIRDGSEMKVKDTLPLSPYLIWVATAKELNIESEIITPRQFAERADRHFQKEYRPDYFYDHY